MRFPQYVTLFVNHPSRIEAKRLVNNMELPQEWHTIQAWGEFVDDGSQRDHMYDFNVDHAYRQGLPHIPSPTLVAQYRSTVPMFRSHPEAVAQQIRQYADVLVFQHYSDTRIGSHIDIIQASPEFKTQLRSSIDDRIAALKSMKRQF
jgi:hypothetical protein